MVSANEMSGSWGSEVHTSGLKTATHEACSENLPNPPVELKKHKTRLFIYNKIDTSVWRGYILKSYDLIRVERIPISGYILHPCPNSGQITVFNKLEKLLIWMSR